MKTTALRSQPWAKDREEHEQCGKSPGQRSDCNLGENSEMKRWRQGDKRESEDQMKETALSPKYQLINLEGLNRIIVLKIKNKRGIC